ncbi:MAG: dienelactone hydrolase family protein [Flavobacterium sp.]
MKHLVFSITLSIFSLTYIHGQTFAYLDDKQSLTGYRAVPETPLSGKPGVLILHAWMGIADHEKEVANELSALGYHAFVTDIYGDGNQPANSQEAGQKSGYYKNNPLEYQKRIRLGLEQLIKSGANPDKIVVIGYCFGGTGAIEAARGQLPVVGVVSFHGGLGKAIERTTPTLNCKVLILHGADDPFVPEKEVLAFQKEMRDIKADWQMIYYANAVHSFTNKKAGNDNSRGAAYNEMADKRSFAHFLTFLQEVF